MMINIEEIRKDFPMLKKTMHGHPLVYLDNGATTLKPQCVIDSVVEYLTSYSGNAHRGDYDLSHEVDEQFELSREKIASFINAKKNEVVFTSGSTDSLNMIAYGFGGVVLNEGDEILLSVAEHASNTLPWFSIADEKKAIVNYIDLDESGKITIDNVKKAMNEHTKIISLAHVTNVLGYEVPIKEICELAHAKGAYVIVDGAQSVPHMRVDVKDLDLDFLAFSGHKMCGPTGIGVLYGKYDLLVKMKPLRLGGGSNTRYNSCGVVTLKNPPYKFEAGTPHIEGVVGLGSAVDYLLNIGIDEIREYEKYLRDYCISKMKELDNIEIYNSDSCGAIAFNIKNVFSQDGASLFNTYGIAVRAGQHCAKILDNYLDVTNTLRVSFYFYNTIEEIDKFIEVCKKGDEFLDAFFG